MIDKLENASIDRFMREVAERWRTTSMELYCVQSMLEEVVAYWKRWDTLSVEVEGWIDEAHSKLHLPEEQKMQHFQVTVNATKTKLYFCKFEFKFQFLCSVGSGIVTREISHPRGYGQLLSCHQRGKHRP